ncbi:MAG: cysteine desulfurase [Planctomycetes bacterium]|nr:cysteine desulfurase [Planctomycetota bacterium]
MPSPIYLDHNATAPPLPEVLDEVVRVMRDCYGNPGSRHRAGRKARQVLEECRERLAGWLGATPGELIFTSGGTEANNMAIQGLTQGPAGTIVLSPGEHPSILQACKSLQSCGWKLHPLPVDSAGRLLMDELPADTRLVAILLAHNETGVIQDVKPLAKVCRARGIPLHLDAVQAVGKVPVDFLDLDATSLSFGAHKFHGPRGVGGLLVRDGTHLSPLLHGGHQEAERRAGTEAVALIAGMSKALQLWNERRAWHEVRVQQLRDHFQTILCQQCNPAVVNGGEARRLPNTLNISFPGVDGEALLVALDLEGVACSLGTTCASGSSEPAPILVAMGLTPDLYRSAIRFSLSFLNTHDELELAAARIARVVATLRKPV